MRAALSLHVGINGLNDYIQDIRQHQQEIQRENFVRQMLLQEQIEKQLGGRSPWGHQAAGVDEQQYRQLLLKQLQDQQQQRREQEEEYVRLQAAAQLRYQDELRRQQLASLTSDEAAHLAAHALAAQGRAGVLPTFATSAAGLQVAASGLAGLPSAHSPMMHSPQTPPFVQDLTQDDVKQPAKRSMSVVDEEVEPAMKRQALDHGHAALFLSPELALYRAEPAAVAAVAALAQKPLDQREALAAVALAADAVAPMEETPVKGSVEDLLEAAEDAEKLGDAAIALEKFKEADWKEEDDAAEVPMSPKQTKTPAEAITLPNFHSELPALPEEPLYRGPTISAVDILAEQAFVAQESEINSPSNGAAAYQEQDPARKKSAVILDWPYPVDTWWPSPQNVRRERRQDGETSDEDNFEETPRTTGHPTHFRANERKIRSRLANDVEPGVLEKLCHCRVHRIRSKQKKNTYTPELVYCWQVTELYPNDIMVNCSRCGTWRHAACGGHYKQYSTRDNTKTPFVAVCENCHEEEVFLQGYPKAEQRIERQRMEQLRRALATSAVMRNASYSKHSGTYKWPLGSVSATHIGGHTRSVHARHDKAERQWADMANRLGKSFGSRPKDRVRVRTKELERLLVSIEDAESYTDRHNMMLFLLRDTARKVPVGYDDIPRNLFDPAEDEPAESDDRVNSEEGSGLCARKGCIRNHRFDSLFCSDACGVMALEMDLLRSLQDASDVHPSVLRLS